MVPFYRVLALDDIPDGCGSWRRWQRHPAALPVMRFVVCFTWVMALTFCRVQVRSFDLAAAQAPDRAQAQAMAKRAADRIAALHKEAETLAAQERTVLDELRRLEVEQQLKREELTLVELNYQKIASELADTRTRLTALETTVRLQLPGMQKRLIDLYKLGRAGYVRMLLNVSDLNAMGRAYRTVSELARLDSRRAAEHQQTITALRAAEKALGERAEAMARTESSVRRARNELDKAVANRNALISGIDDRRDLAARYLGELQEAHERLEATLAAGDGRGAFVALPIAPFKGALDWPARGPVLTRFGSAVSRGATAVLRQGLELSVVEGTGVHAVHDGRVAFADAFAGFGNLVIVEHGPDTHTLYGYLSTIDVAPGAIVRARDPIGTTGRAPAGPPALYFELRIDARPVDPLQWLKR